MLRAPLSEETVLAFNPEMGGGGLRDLKNIYKDSSSVWPLGSLINVNIYPM